MPWGPDYPPLPRMESMAHRGEKRPPEPLSSAEIRSLLAAFNRGWTGDRNRALVVVLARAGLRLGEALALFPRDLDPDAMSVRVRGGRRSRVVARRRSRSCGSGSCAVASWGSAGRCSARARAGRSRIATCARRWRTPPGGQASTSRSVPTASGTRSRPSLRARASSFWPSRPSSGTRASTPRRTTWWPSHRAVVQVMANLPPWLGEDGR